MKELRRVLEQLRSSSMPIDETFYQNLVSALDGAQAGLLKQGRREVELAEYAISKMGLASREDIAPGELYTPRDVARVMAELLQPREGVVYDPCCGSGGLLLEASQHMRREGAGEVRLLGQERSGMAWNISRMNMLLHGEKCDLGARAADALKEDLHPGVLVDYSLGNPPFNAKNWTWEGYERDERWKYGVPPASNANFAFLQAALAHLNERGRMAMVLPNSTLEGGSAEECAIRENLIRADLVEAVLQLPDGLFYNTNIAVCVWFLSRAKARKGEIGFFDGRGVETRQHNGVRSLTDESIRLLAGAVGAFRMGRKLETELPCAKADLEKAAAQGWSLLPAWYISGPPGRSLWTAGRGAWLEEALERNRREEDRLNRRLAAHLDQLER